MRLGHDVDRANDGSPATSSATWVAIASHSRTASISPFTMPRASQPRLSDIQSSPSKPGLSRSNAALIAPNRSLPTAAASAAGSSSTSSCSAIEAITSSADWARLTALLSTWCAASRPLIDHTSWEVQPRPSEKVWASCSVQTCSRQVLAMTSQAASSCSLRSSGSSRTLCSIAVNVAARGAYCGTSAKTATHSIVSSSALMRASAPRSRWRHHRSRCQVSSLLT